jgi:hypothetical protein
MKPFLSILLLSFILVLFAGCQEAEPVSSNASAVETEQTELMQFCKHGPDKDITVMTRNVYVGADIDKVITATNEEELVQYATEAFMSLGQTNFWERAVALAREIKWTRPDLVGFQEISTIQLQIPGGEMEVVYDYEAILMATLSAMDLPYKVAAKVKNFEVEVPVIVGENEGEYVIGTVRLTDYDLVIARKNVQISNIQTGNYQYFLQVPSLIPGETIDIVRGYVILDARVDGRLYHFANTHLEALTGDPVMDSQILLLQQAQMAELLAMVGEPSCPTVIVGDFNSPAPDWPVYQAMLACGFKDSWLENGLWLNEDGFTYGHDLDLMNTFANFYERIDFVFTRNIDGPVWAIVVGDEYTNRTESGLWPSDHGGVVARLFSEKEKVNAYK